MPCPTEFHHMGLNNAQPRRPKPDIEPEQAEVHHEHFWENPDISVRSSEASGAYENRHSKTSVRLW